MQLPFTEVNHIELQSMEAQARGANMLSVMFTSCSTFCDKII